MDDNPKNNIAHEDSGDNGPAEGSSPEQEAAAQPPAQSKDGLDEAAQAGESDATARRVTDASSVGLGNIVDREGGLSSSLPPVPPTGSNGAPAAHRTIKIIASAGEVGGPPLEPTTIQPDAPRAGARQTQPNEPKPRADLRREQVVKSSRPGDRIIRYSRNVGPFRSVGGRLVAGIETEAPRGNFGRFTGRIKRVLIGKPISSEHAIHERLTKVKALAVLSSDALSSVAYATEEIVRVLVLTGLATLSALTMPVGIAIMVLLAIVAASYRQTILAYPRGGGSYIVAKDNLGTLPGLTAAASILIDYTMTVAVSTSAGIAALYSLFPEIKPYRVELGIAIVILVTIANLRGVREAGNIFAVPTYLFVVGLLGMIAWGFVRMYLGFGGALVYAAPPDAVQPGANALTVFLILRAFTQGSTALTGVEAIADGVPAFKPPEASNARITLVAMAAIAITMFGGITFLSAALGIRPSETETVLSQLARTILGSGVPWYFINISTALILILAANTAFSDFPRLSYFLARDKFMPHQYSFRGDRLAFSWGIVTLAVLACILLIAFRGDTTALIPLYTVGVFNSFTLSQFGMVLRWWRTKTPGWQRGFALNGLGAIATFLVLIISAVTKFTSGAWIVIALIPVLIAMFLAINRHYKRVSSEVASAEPLAVPGVGTFKHTFIVPVSSLNPIALSALAYARSLSPNVTAVHIAEGEDEEESERFREKWYSTVQDRSINLVIIESPFRSLIGPLLHFIDTLDQQYADDTITIVLPEVLPSRFWEYLLHNQSALRLKAALLFRPNTVVADMPYVLGRHQGIIRRSAFAALPIGPVLVLLIVLAVAYFFFFRA